MELLILCLKIFFCRIMDVSLGTARLITVVKGKNLIACIIGIGEALIWYVIVREALFFDASTPFSYWAIALSYAGGFATGTFVGGKCSDKFLDGNVTVQIVTSGKNDEILKIIREEGFAITALDINTSLFSKKKYMIFAEIKKSQLKVFKELINMLDEKAFITVQETKVVYNGFFKK